jgi:hypothetical protein
MQRLTRYCAGWVAATTLATGVSWVAIQNLVTTAALSQPSVPFGAAAVAASVPAGIPTGPSVTPSAPAATEPAASTAPVRTTAAPTPRRSAPAVRTPATPVSPAGPATPTARTPGSAKSASVQGYSLKGGQIVLELRPDSAALVSAIPAAGYRTETWSTEYWLRVDFARGDQRSSMIVSWYQHAPTVQQTEF